MSTGTPSSIIMASSVTRPIAKFHPCIWGDHFINYTPNNEEVVAKRKQEHESLKSEVKKELLKSVGKPLEHLQLIDAIERLGIAYHFEKEIEESLGQIYNYQDVDKLNLYHSSLRFRILRQHGYNISSNAFLKFMDKDGSFLEILENDVAGLLSLYEASSFRGNGEDILEKAFEFSKARLKVIAAQKSHPLATQIAHALAFPIHMCVIRIESRNYLSYYEQDPCHNESFLRLAKLDFNLLQTLYKEELQELIKWEMGSADQLPDYMKLFYEIQYNTYKQFEDELAKLGRRNDVHHAVQELINVSRWYLQEARWREAKYIPTFDEYFENAIRSIACTTMVIVSFLDNELEESVAEKAFESVSRYCKPQKATCIIGRLSNDLGDYKWDKHRDHVVGAVDYYMKQHGVSEEEAYSALNMVIENAWKDLNEEIFRPVTPIPRPLVNHIYNFCRTVEYVYKNEDGFTVVSQRVKDAIKLLFIEPLAV